MASADPHRDLPGAVRAGRAADVLSLLDAGVRPDQMNIYGDTLIDMARDRGHDDVVAVLEEACARARRVAVSPTHTDHPIHVAAETGDLRRVRGLLDSDPSLVRISDRAAGTALHRAVIGHAFDVVDLLLSRGADIHAIHGEGLGTRQGYAPENLQAIDLAIWGGPATTRPSRSRILWSCVKWLLWRLPILRVCETHGQTGDLRFLPRRSSAIGTSSRFCSHAAPIRRGPTATTPPEAQLCTRP